MSALSVRSFASFTLPVGLLASLVVGPAQAQPPRLDVPYVPTPEPVVAHMLQLAEIGPDDYVIDLGSGDGRIAISAVQDHGARAAYGIDLTLNASARRRRTPNARAWRTRSRLSRVTCSRRIFPRPTC